MNIHKNARLTLSRRIEMVRSIVDRGLRPADAAAEAGVSEPTGRKWLGRYLAEGESGLRDWVRMFGGVFLGAMRPEGHERFFRLVEQRLRPTQFRDGRWHADYRRLRIVARRTPE